MLLVQTSALPISGICGYNRSGKTVFRHHCLKRSERSDLDMRFRSTYLTLTWCSPGAFGSNSGTPIRHKRKLNSSAFRVHAAFCRADAVTGIEIHPQEHRFVAGRRRL
jgi:hypothetical protein